MEGYFLKVNHSLYVSAVIQGLEDIAGLSMLGIALVKTKNSTFLDKEKSITQVTELLGELKTISYQFTGGI